MITLQTIWFILIAVLLVGYTVLDGFDLGVGLWHLFAKKDEERRTFLAAIGPYWDGNEVWLLTGGGALFAAFPPVYASVFSACYLALMLVLLALILRAVSIEWRGKETTQAARSRWDITFALGSMLATLLFGVAFGNILRGLPINAQGDFTGTFFTLLNPFALLVGITNVALIATHGAFYLAMRTEGELSIRVAGWARKAWMAYLPLALITVISAALTQPHLLENYHSMPLLWAVPALALAAIMLAGHWNNERKEKPAFAASSVSIALLMISAAIGLFPNLLPALDNATLSLTAYNSSSSQLTLTVMLTIALVGMALVAGYTTWVYRTFGGKVRSEGEY